LKKSMFLVVLAALLLALTTAPAFAAAQAHLLVNGDRVPAPVFVIEDGVTMVAAETYTGLAGADFSEAGDTYTITENDATLSLTNGKYEAMLDGQAVALPRAPYRANGTVYIPLRAVASAFGFEVDWNAETLAVILNRNETRDGMNPSDLLVKATAASQAYNTYSMSGAFDMFMKLMADGQILEETPIQMGLTLEGQIQENPMKLYVVETILANEAAQILEMAIEMYMDEEKMYMKMPGEDWTALEQPFSAEFWQGQQSIQSDPLEYVEQMKEMGIILNFGNDRVVDGKNYYVVNASFDVEKFMENFQGMFQQIVQSVPVDPATDATAEEAQQELQKLLANSRMDFSYTVCINKETLISDIVELDMKMELVMDIPEVVESEAVENETGEPVPQKINIFYDIKGKFNISGLGEPFVAPEINASAVTP
jgi:hypothetical protein